MRGGRKTRTEKLWGKNKSSPKFQVNSFSIFIIGNRDRDWRTAGMIWVGTLPLTAGSLVLSLTRTNVETKTLNYSSSWWAESPGRTAPWISAFSNDASTNDQRHYRAVWAAETCCSSRSEVRSRNLCPHSTSSVPATELHSSLVSLKTWLRRNCSAPHRPLLMICLVVHELVDFLQLLLLFPTRWLQFCFPKAASGQSADPECLWAPRCPSHFLHQSLG